MEDAIAFYSGFLESRFEVARFHVFFALADKGDAAEYHRAASSSIPIIAAHLERNPRSTIVGTVAELMRSRVLREQCASGPMATAAAHIVFTVIGWIPFLYNPQLDYVSLHLSVVWEDNAMFDVSQQELHHATQQPLVLFLRRFGNLIPGNWNRSHSIKLLHGSGSSVPGAASPGSTNGADDTLHVSKLNAAHLKKVKTSSSSGPCRRGHTSTGKESGER